MPDTEERGQEKCAGGAVLDEETAFSSAFSLILAKIAFFAQVRRSA
jgi:hypothetical protein